MPNLSFCASCLTPIIDDEDQLTCVTCGRELNDPIHALVSDLDKSRWDKVMNEDHEPEEEYKGGYDPNE